MKKAYFLASLLVVAGVMMFVLPISAMPPGTDGFNTNKSVSVPCVQPEGVNEGETAGTIAYNGPTLLWPPNHKMYGDSPDEAISITASDEDSGDNVENMSSTASHDQMLPDGSELNGSGPPNDVAGPDVTPAVNGPTSGTGSATLSGYQVKAERSGRDKTGRTYGITVNVDFTDSDNDDSSDDRTSCQVTFSICVPHDMRASYREQGDAQKCPQPTSVQGTNTAAEQTANGAQQTAANTVEQVQIPSL